MLLVKQQATCSPSTRKCNYYFSVGRSCSDTVKGKMEAKNKIVDSTIDDGEDLSREIDALTNDVQRSNNTIEIEIDNNDNDDNNRFDDVNYNNSIHSTSQDLLRVGAIAVAGWRNDSGAFQSSPEADNVSIDDIPNDMADEADASETVTVVNAHLVDDDAEEQRIMARLVLQSPQATFVELAHAMTPEPRQSSPQGFWKKNGLVVAVVITVMVVAVTIVTVVMVVTGSDENSDGDETPGNGSNNEEIFDPSIRIVRDRLELLELIDEYLLYVADDVALPESWIPMIKWDVSNVVDCAGLFAKVRNERVVRFNDPGVSFWNTGRCRSMAGMFYGASSFDQNLTGWNTESVTNMRGMFAEASSFNGDISTWDTSRVVDMRDMFYGAVAFDQDLSRWNVSSVTDMSYMFGHAASFNQALSTWDVSRVTNMVWTFSYALSFNQNLSTWNVSSVKDMRWMFNDATSFNNDVSTWDVSRVAKMTGMFDDAVSFNQDLSKWDVSNVWDSNYMFFRASSFNSDLSRWNFSTTVTDLIGMFEGATSFNQDLSTWNVSRVRDLSRMFHNASSFNQDLSTWNVWTVTSMERMFKGAESFNQDISTWDVSSVSIMDSMFLGAATFNQDLSAWNVSSVTTMRQMFMNASSFNQNLCRWRETLNLLVSRDETFVGTACFSTSSEDLCFVCTDS